MAEERGPFSGKRVLIAEDDGLIAEDLRALVERQGGIVVIMAPTTAGALAAVERHAVDLALLDVRLGDGTAEDVARALRARRIPFIVVTGYARDGLPPLLRDAPFVAKPYLPRELAAVAALLLG